MIEFVLVEPALPENVGAAARALKTMGFDSLCIVNSTAHEEDRAQWVAHGSDDILRNARVVSTLAEALEGASLSVATTARKRTMIRIAVSARDLPALIESKGGYAGRVCIVFGCESDGLSTADLALCDIVSYIPLAVDFPSLNLSQAVMLYAYELSRLTAETQAAPPDEDSLAILRSRVEILMRRAGFDMNRTIMTRVNERIALANDKDIKVLHAIIGRILKRLGEIESDD